MLVVLIIEKPGRLEHQVHPPIHPTRQHLLGRLQELNQGGTAEGHRAEELVLVGGSVVVEFQLEGVGGEGAAGLGGERYVGLVPYGVGGLGLGGWGGGRGRVGGGRMGVDGRGGGEV
jgi:hypothetical protein